MAFQSRPPFLFATDRTRCFSRDYNAILNHRFIIKTQRDWREPHKCVALTEEYDIRHTIWPLGQPTQSTLDKEMHGPLNSGSPTLQIAHAYCWHSAVIDHTVGRFILKPFAPKKNSKLFQFYG